MKNKIAPIIVDLIVIIIFTIILYYNFNSDSFLSKGICILAILHFGYSLLKELFSKEQAK
ncbi:hypothetical protein BU064_14450 [Staphylococcus succinus]|nr:hypothetical protein BU064_14450 [Staphylococcus succinus]